MHFAKIKFEAVHGRNRRLHTKGLCLQGFQLLFPRLAVLGIYLASTQNNYLKKEVRHLAGCQQICGIADWT